MVVPLGMRYFLGVPKSSVRYQPLRFTKAPVGLESSIASSGNGSVWVKASLTKMVGREVVPGSAAPGVPLTTPLGRQLVWRPQESVGPFSLIIWSENPGPSVIGYHLSS